MNQEDYFHDSVPDGLSIAINDFDSSTKCSNQDSWEVLILTFGREVTGDDLKSADEEDFERFAQSMKTWFELTYLPTADDAKRIINHALMQWCGFSLNDR